MAHDSKKRHFACQFCNLFLPRDKMRKHEEFCGSRTDICWKCETYVLVKDRDKHAKVCNGDNPALPCEFCEVLIPGDRLGTHQQQCLIERRHASVRQEDTNGAFREFATTSKRDKSDEKRSSKKAERKVRKEKKTPVDPEPVKERRQSVDSNNIIALPCEICGELCPSDKLMQHQIDCNQESQERENVSEHNEDPRPEHNHSPPREREPSSRTANSSEIPHVRFIEIQRSYSPTIEFEDEFFTERFSPDITVDSFTRVERRSTNSRPPRETFPTREYFTDRSGIPDIRFIEIERSYSPTVEFEEEYFPEAFNMHNSPEFFHIPHPFGLFESGHQTRSTFNQQRTRRY